MLLYISNNDNLILGTKNGHLIFAITSFARCVN